MFGRIIGALGAVIAEKISDLQLSADQRRLYSEAQIRVQQEVASREVSGWVDRPARGWEEFGFSSSMSNHSSSVSSTSSSETSTDKKVKPKPKVKKEFFKKEDFDIE